MDTEDSEQVVDIDNVAQTIHVTDVIMPTEETIVEEEEDEEGADDGGSQSEDMEANEKSPRKRMRKYIVELVKFVIVQVSMILLLPNEILKITSSIEYEIKLNLCIQM